MNRACWFVGFIASIGLFLYVVVYTNIEPIYAFPLGGITGLCLGQTIFPTKF